MQQYYLPGMFPCAILRIKEKALPLASHFERYNGGLIYESAEEKILLIEERIFRQLVLQLKITGQKRLHLKLLTKNVYDATISENVSA